MLQNQLARGNNGLIKTKYLTFSIEADSIRSAKPRLERIETDVLNNFKRLGVAAEVLDGKARLAQLHAIFHMDEQAPFPVRVGLAGSQRPFPPRTLSRRPASSSVPAEQFRMGKKYGAVSFVQILAPELNDRMQGGFSRYGKFPHCESAHPVGGSGEGHQDGEAQDHRPGPQQDRGTEKGRRRAGGS